MLRLCALLLCVLPAASLIAQCPLNTASPSVTICSPANGTTVSNPVQITAGTTDNSYPVTAMTVYVDNAAVYTANASSISKSLWISYGTHNITINAWDSSGAVFLATSIVNVFASTSSVQITTPSNNATVASPFKMSANIRPGIGFDHTNVLVDGQSIFRGGQVLQNEWMFLPGGTHSLALVASDVNNKLLAQQTMLVNVLPQTAAASITQIQNLPGFGFCTATLNGQPCASGLGNATSQQTRWVSKPSLSGASASFTLAGPTGYSNALWWKSLGGGTTPTQFTYDVYFLVSDPSAPEALEFDVNQSFGGTRWTWGTECSYKNTLVWDIWDPQGGFWVPTNVGCPQVSAGWHHLTWHFARVGNQVQYISLTLDGKTSPLNIFKTAQPNFWQEDINVAFQLDGDYKQTPYTVWLDKWTLTAQ